MKISIEERPDLSQTEVLIRCPGVDDPQVTALLDRLRDLADRPGPLRLMGLLEGETRVLEPAQVLYIDTADRATFLYTADGVYETPLRLYELEQRLAGLDFLRISKSAILNFDHVRALRPDLGGRMRLKLSNGETVVANRQYVPAIKAKLGLGKEK